MRIFQNVGIYSSYARRLAELVKDKIRYQGMMDVFRQDRFEATHLLRGILNQESECFLSIGNFSPSQKQWAAEFGLSRQKSKDSTEILLAQMEEHRTEVFYNLDPIRFDDTFLKRLPGTVRQTVAWIAAPSPHMRFSGYGLIVNNFPNLLKRYAAAGCRTSYFFPSYDPEMDAAAAQTHRPIDVVFVGGFSRHHIRRAGILESVAKLRTSRAICYYLDLGRLNVFAESKYVEWTGLLARHRRPEAIRSVAHLPVFGREMHRILGQSKIVLNAAVDMAAEDRGNIRCFEAMGCGALLLSDIGNYPDGMVPNQTMVTYRDATDAGILAQQLLDDHLVRRQIARSGHEMVRERYSKTAQWNAFNILVS
jgi:hypothetical protein